MSSKAKQLDVHILDTTVENTETEIAHDLGRKPVDGIIATQSTPGDIYRGPTEWTSTSIFLIASQFAIARILIF